MYKKVQYIGVEKVFKYREKSKSDLLVIAEIFQRHVYNISSFQQANSFYRYYARYIKKYLKPFIIDAGANIGISSSWFSIVYPLSRIVAIEPDQDNIELLIANCKDVNIKILNGAIGSSPGKMYLHDPGHGEWAYRILAAKSKTQVEIFSGEEIMNHCDNRSHFPFIFKIDIEGGENNLFEKNTDWISAFPLIIIETHDWMLPGESNSNSFYKFIAAGKYDLIHQGELLFAFNNNILNCN